MGSAEPLTASRISPHEHPESAAPGPVPSAHRSARQAPFARIVVATLARAILTLILTLLVCGVAPTLVGWHTTTVMSGSMAPRIQPGDVVVAAPVDPSLLRTGQVLVVRDPDRPGALRLHRFVGIDAAGLLILRGDANPQPDSSHVARSAVVGVARLLVPGIGSPALWIRTATWGPLIALALAVLALLACSTLDRAAPAARALP